MRAERLDKAREFARKLSQLGDSSGLDLIDAKRANTADREELLGGADAFHFLLFGKGKTNAERLFVDCNHLLSSLAEDSSKLELQHVQQVVREYFQVVSALAALGTRKGDHVEIVLSINDKGGRQRT
ncbi:MAG: hypothetical protein JO097_20165, partial [Acidobacteriaceae bacterium]|nr:hypothetical protein [Acidobacteriaceae bacterium]